MVEAGHFGNFKAELVCVWHYLHVDLSLAYLMEGKCQRFDSHQKGPVMVRGFGISIQRHKPWAIQFRPDTQNEDENKTHGQVASTKCV